MGTGPGGHPHGAAGGGAARRRQPPAPGAARARRRSGRGPRRRGTRSPGATGRRPAGGTAAAWSASCTGSGRTAEPPPEAVSAINRLAELPQLIKDRLAAGLDAIHVGGGGVPDLDDMGRLKGVPLPSGRATWDACAGAYGEQKIIVGSRPSPTPDVMCHEIGHALDDIDGTGGTGSRTRPTSARSTSSACRTW